MSSVWDERRNLVAFWFLGLCNNFAYVIMLSAAHDILGDEENCVGNRTIENNLTTIIPVITTVENKQFLSCNQIGTGAILLADILPNLCIKSTGPYYLQRIEYRIKVIFTILFALASFLIVGFAEEVWLSIFGVVCASISTGLGEITFISLTTFFNRNVISTWSSGTGGAGVLGSLAYAGLTTLGVSPRSTVLIMVIFPVIMTLSYFLVLVHPKELDSSANDKVLLKESSFLCCMRRRPKSPSIRAVSMKTLQPGNVGIDNDGFTVIPTNNILTNGHTNKLSNNEESVIEGKKAVNLPMKQKLRLMMPLLKYLIPLTAVYFAEYFINQGLHELLYYNDIWLKKKEQYRWYQVDYQVGVFISRSSVNFFQIKKLWILPVLQLINMSVFLAQVFYRFIPSIWIIFAIVFFEGLLGGAAYVNTFYRISVEIPEEHREFSMGAATLGDTFGIAVAGAVAIPSHNQMCSLKIKMN